VDQQFCTFWSVVTSKDSMREATPWKKALLFAWYSWGLNVDCPEPTFAEIREQKRRWSVGVTITPWPS
jgi:hypothetical protein